MVVIRTKEEIEKIAAACKITAKVRETVKHAVRPGISTAELDEIAEKMIRELGAEPAFKGYRGYSHATCMSVNYEVVHGIPSDKLLNEGDIIGVDVGVKYRGYFGDSAVTVAAGSISKKAEKLLKITEQALYLAIDQVKPGNHIGDIAFAVESHAKKNGYTVVKDLFGHGIGEALHEDPLVPNYGVPGEGIMLKPGMVFAIEPMLNEGGHEIKTLSDGWTVITRDRKLSAHFEHTVCVTEDGVRILTVEA